MGPDADGLAVTRSRRAERGYLETSEGRLSRGLSGGQFALSDSDILVGLCGALYPNPLERLAREVAGRRLLSGDAEDRPLGICHREYATTHDVARLGYKTGSHGQTRQASHTVASTLRNLWRRGPDADEAERGATDKEQRFMPGVRATGAPPSQARPRSAPFVRAVSRCTARRR